MGGVRYLRGVRKERRCSPSAKTEFSDATGDMAGGLFG